MQKVEKLPIDQIRPNPDNPRRCEPKQLARLVESIRSFPRMLELRPIVVDADGTVLGGNQRLSACRELGLSEVPIVRADDLTEEQCREFILRDNAPSGEWDFEKLLADWDVELLERCGLDLPREFSAPDTTIDSEAASPNEGLREKYGVEMGQLWTLGDHRILCGDSGSGGDTTAVLKADRATCIFTDPPYGVSIGKKNEFLNSFQKAGRNLKSIESDDLKPDELKKILLPIFTNVRELAMADDCTLFVCAPQGGEPGMMMMMMMQEARLAARHVLIWKKNQPTFSMGRLDYDYAHEPILLTWGKRHKRPMKGEHRTSIWEIDKPRESKSHPTMKPVELYTNAYLNNSDSGDVVFEPFSGSGTAIIAAEQTARKCRAIEIDPEYVAVAIDRWERATGKTAVREV